MYIGLEMLNTNQWLNIMSGVFFAGLEMKYNIRTRRTTEGSSMVYGNKKNRWELSLIL